MQALPDYKRGRKAVCWPARSGLVKSKPERRYASFSKINYLIIKRLQNVKYGKNTDISVTA
jgi:hypothetical protein